MYKYIGLKWQDIAQDRDDYKNKVYVAKFQATNGAVTFAT